MGRWREIGAGLGRHPLRTILVLLTFSLAFSMVIATIATVEGGRRSIVSDLENLGVDVIGCLNPMRIGPAVLGRSTRGARPVDTPMIAELEKTVGADARAVIPFRMELSNLFDDRWRITTSMMATRPEFVDVLKGGLMAGRFFDENDSFGAEPIPIVLDGALAADFNDDPASLVGYEMSFFRFGRIHEAVVIGIMNDPISLRQHFDAFDANKQARSMTARRLEFKNLYVPYRRGEDEPSGVLVQVPDVDDVEPMVARLEAFFTEQKADPFIYVQKSWIDSVSEMVDRFSSLTHFLWVLVLVVVLILTGTVSLIAIEERYHEIAIRRVEGASVAQVVVPILTEGGILALLAFPIGHVVARWLIDGMITPVVLWEPRLAAFDYLWLLPVVFVVGLASNLLAARRVAKLVPAAILSDYEG